jgi:hypothetical protein
MVGEDGEGAMDRPARGFIAGRDRETGDLIQKTCMPAMWA